MKVTEQRKARRQEGFTMVEVLVGLTIFMLIAASATWGLNQLNYYASVNRLYTAAQTLAQNQIDLILTKAPYNPTLSQVPQVLTTGTYYWNPLTPDTKSATPVSVPIYYYDSGGTQVNVVMGTIQTKVEKMEVSISGTDLNLRRASVVVSYTFRNKTFNVKMDTIRSPDI